MKLHETVIFILNGVKGCLPDVSQGAPNLMALCGTHIPPRIRASGQLSIVDKYAGTTTHPP